MAEKAGVQARTQESKQKYSIFCKRKFDYNSSISPAERILQLQRTAGNQVVQRLVKSRALQAKLRIGQPNDIYEQEADRVADQVMRMTDPVFQRKCAKCSRDEKKVLQTKELPGQLPVTLSHHVPPVVQEILRSPGQPLDPATRAFMEPRFGYDFSGVRVHSGTAAEQSARDLNARAYTLGDDMVFGAGEFAPETSTGRSLLAHELVHTIQQTGTGSSEIRRKTGDGHDLTASRFAGDSVLEAVYDNKRVLKSGNTGAAVRKLQQALLDAGFSLPRFGVDGIFGSETMAAVMEFQRASGIGGGGSGLKGIDGIVDAITLGWLDQRFSAGPTPPGATSGATPGCPAFKTVNVDLISLDGSTRGGSSTQDLDRANSIFNQCCVRFALTGGGSVGSERTRDLLGGDTVLHINPRIGNPTTEEISMFNGAAADFNLSGRIRVFYVDSLTPSSTPFGHTDAYSVPPFAATGSGAAVRNMVIITNTGSVRALAHEFGHILLDQGMKAHYGVDGNILDPNYLMSPAGPTPGERLTPTQCRTIFDNA